MKQLDLDSACARSRASRVTALLLIAWITGPGCSTAYRRTGDPDKLFESRRVALGVFGFPGVVMDVNRMGRGIGGSFGGVGMIVGSSIDRSRNQALLDSVLGAGVRESSRDALVGLVQPIAAAMETLTVESWTPLPEVVADAQRLLDALPLDRERFAADCYLTFYGAPDDGAGLHTKIVLSYLMPDGSGLRPAWVDVFACDGHIVKRSAIEEDPRVATEMVKTSLGVLEPWIRWELTAGKDRLQSRRVAKMTTTDGGFSMTGHVLSDGGEWLVIRGTEGMIYAIPAKFVDVEYHATAD